jgi:hypothetical protein
VVPVTALLGIGWVVRVTMLVFFSRMANLTELAAGGVRRTGRRVDEEG